jgi:hypothetical protein
MGKGKKKQRWKRWKRWKKKNQRWGLRYPAMKKRSEKILVLD